jgi:hypothetical protein
MKKLSRAAQILAAAGLTIGLLGLAAPANAERYGIDDPADAGGSNNDIQAFSYVHGKATVRFVIDVDDLRRVSDGGATVYFDTRSGRKGPEFALGTGLSSGTDYALYRTRGFNPGAGSHPLDCDYQVKLRYKSDKVVGSIARECFGNPKRLRATVRVIDTVDDATVTDWAPGTKAFGLWVHAG